MKSYCIELLKGVLAGLAFGAFIYGSIEAITYVHSQECTGCDWYWCEGGAK